MTDSIRFALLGPLRATRGHEALDLGTRRQNAVLAGLLVTPNQVVSSEALLHGIWGEDCPPSGSRLLATYVYRLRRILDGGGAVIEQLCGGYRLRVDANELDTAEFDEALARAREHREAERHAEARADLTAALRLWRGEPMTGLPGRLLDAERSRWREKRLQALEQRAELGLRCGQSDLAVTELTELRGEEPLREHVAALLMTALYRTGRKCEALSVYADINSRLRTELGIEPGSELSRIHDQVLRGDDEAMGLGAPAAPVAAPVSAGYRDDLPLGTPRFTGRTRELAHVVTEPDEDTTARIIAVDGMPGVGKTAFILEAAARMRARHTDGRFHLDLRSQHPDEAPLPAGEALRCLLSAAGHRAGDLPESVDERAALWRSAVAGRRVLLVLDDADTADQVVPLLPSTPGCTVLVASRHRLCTLPAVLTVRLRPLDAADSEAMLASIVGRQRIEREKAEVGRVIESCGGLPELLAGIAGRVRLGVVTFADLASELSCPGGLAHLAPTGFRDIEAMLGPGWERLAPAEQHALHALAVSGDPGPPATMESLARANLVDEPHDGRYRLHPAVREFARSRRARLTPVATG